MTKNDLTYSDPVARAKYRHDWTKNNYKNIVGLRPLRDVEVETTDGRKLTVTANTFLHKKRGEKTFEILWSEPPLRVHFPRSLGRRVRVTVNEGGRIVAETAKCFAK